MRVTDSFSIAQGGTKVNKLTQEQINAVIESHGKWLRGEPGGSRAYLSSADLSGADLSGADLRSADLRSALS